MHQRASGTPMASARRMLATVSASVVGNRCAMSSVTG